jgi:hypothetical protein
MIILAKGLGFVIESKEEEGKLCFVRKAVGNPN